MSLAYERNALYITPSFPKALEAGKGKINALAKGLHHDLHMSSFPMPSPGRRLQIVS